MNLPAGCQTWASCGWDAAWTVAEHLAARNGDLLAGANWQRGEGKGQPPPPMPRPGDASRADQNRDRVESRAAAFRARQRAAQLALDGAAASPPPPHDAPERTTDGR